MVKKLGSTNIHFWLAQRMAKTTETDLVAAIQEAGLTQAEWGEMVDRCRGCDWVSGCQRWLAEHITPVDEVPSECANRKKFIALKAALKEAGK